MIRRLLCDPPVKIQSVRAAVQCQHRFMRAHLRLQRANHVMPDIRRIGDDQLIFSLAESPVEICCREQIALYKFHALATVGLRVLFGDLQCLRADIRASHLCGRVQFGDRDPDGAAAAAKIQHLDTSAERFFLSVNIAAQPAALQKLQSVFHHRLGILAWDQDIRADGKRQTHEFLPSGDMLQRHTGCTLLHQPKIGFALIVLQRPLPCHHQSGAIQPLHITVKLFRVDRRVGNACVGKHLFSDPDHFL